MATYLFETSFNMVPTIGTKKGLLGIQVWEMLDQIAKLKSSYCLKKCFFLKAVKVV